MPATEFQGSSAGFNQFGRSVFSLKRHQLVNPVMEGQALDLETFQTHVADCFQHLSRLPRKTCSLLHWLRDLLDGFLRIHEEFKLVILASPKSHGSRPTVDRLLSDYFERSVKALDVCNAIRDGIEQMRQWQKLLEIVLCALDRDRTLGEGQFRRAKKALIDLAIAMLDDKESNSNTTLAPPQTAPLAGATLPRRTTAPWATSDLCRGASRAPGRRRSSYRRLGTTCPRRGRTTSRATNGLAPAVFTMNSVLLFVMWGPGGGDSVPGTAACRSISRFRGTFGWAAAPLLSMQERIMEESKRRDRRNACALLKEILQIEKCSRGHQRVGGFGSFPLSEDKEGR
ncbi:hypothetical protein M0R45_009484 [Rubus argutus]|uniref:Uncharacterized protein n=1 Tax=Rubus argutus TaxID=59490 RepID=A0AAW1Y4L3_RUBAR